jgi:hypothetical protein
MASFDKGPNLRTPFGSWNFLRSTQDFKTESYTLSAASVPTNTIDGAPEKWVRKGETLAKITSGPEAGKVGPFQADATDGRQTAANIVGINNTELPWQTLYRDVEVAAVYECAAVQGWCFQRNAAGERIPLTNTTADAMRGTKTLDILFK